MPKSETSSPPGAIPTALLFRHHASFIAAFLLRLGAHPDERDDLVQEVFMTAHRRGGFVDDGRAKASTWLCSIAVKVLANHRRKASRRPQAAQSVGTTDVSEGQMVPQDATSLPDQRAEDRQSLSRAHAAMNALSPDLRAIFVLYELEGESCVDIADIVEIPVGTVYSRLHQARKLFKSAFAKSARRPLVQRSNP